MTAKEYLQQAYFLDREIQLNIEKIARMRSSLYGKAQGYQNTGGKGNNYGSFDSAVQKIIDYEREVNIKTAALVLKRLEIEEAINAVSDDRQREILTRRYLLYQKWEEIALIINYNITHVFRLHNSALENMQLNVSIEV